MNTRTTIALLLLLVVVGAFAWFLGVGSPEDGTHTGDSADGRPVLPADIVAVEAVTQIDIQRGDDALTITRDGANWRLTSPVSLPLSSWQVERIITAGANLRSQETLTPGEMEAPTLEAVGLDSPRATITYHAGQDAATIRLGREAIGGKAYAQLPNEQAVELVDAGLHSAVLNVDFKNWRDRSLDLPESLRVRKVAIRPARGEAVQLFKRGQDWFLTEHASERADAEAVQELLGAIQRLSVEKFITDTPRDLSLFGLASPTLVVAVTATDPTAATPAANEPAAPGEAPRLPTITHTLRVGQPAGMDEQTYYATLSHGEDESPIVFTLRKHLLEPVEPEVASLRDARLFVTPSSETERVTVRREPQEGLSLQQTRRGLAFASDPGFQVDKAAASAWLDALLAMRASAFAPPPAHDELPAIDVELAPTDADAPERVRLYDLGEAAKPRYLAQRNSETIAGLLDAEDIAPLLREPIELRERQILSLVPQSIEHLSVRRDDGYTFQFDVSQAGENEPLTIALDGEDAFEAEAAARLLRSLAGLHAAEWLASMAGPDEDSALIATMTRPTGDEVVLTVAPDSGNATLSGVDGVFRVSNELLSMLKAEYRQTRLIDVAPGDILEAATSPGSDVEGATKLARDAEGKLTLVGDGSLDAKAATAFVDALAGLETDRYLSDKPAEAALLREITFIPRGQTARTLRLLAGNVVELDGGWYRIAPGDAARLAAPLKTSKGE